MPRITQMQYLRAALRARNCSNRGTAADSVYTSSTPTRPNAGEQPRDTLGLNAAVFGVLRTATNGHASGGDLGNECSVDEPFMVVELSNGALNGVGGTLRYREEFREVSA